MNKQHYFVEVEYIFRSIQHGATSTGEIYSVLITHLNFEGDSEEENFIFKEGMDGFDKERVDEFLRMTEYFSARKGNNIIWQRDIMDAKRINDLGLKLIYHPMWPLHSTYCSRTLSDFSGENIERLANEKSADHLRRILLFLGRG